MKAKNAIKSAFFETNHSSCFGAKQKMSETPDFEVVLVCNRKYTLDF